MARADVEIFFSTNKPAFAYVDGAQTAASTSAVAADEGIGTVSIDAPVVGAGTLGAAGTIVAPTGNILYVNNSHPSASDSTSYGDNSASLPWATLLRAVRGNSDGNRNTAGVASEAAQAGDTVIVSAGTYDYDGAAYTSESWIGVLYGPINSGVTDAWIEFQAGGEVILTGNTSGLSGMIGTDGAEYIKWNGFTLNESLSSYRNGMVNVVTNNVSIEGCTVIGEFHDVPDNHPGMMIHGPRGGDCTGKIDNITIRNNTISGFTGPAPSRNDSGITMYCIGDNILVENNDISGCHSGINGKNSFEEGTGITIRYNNFHDNSGDGIAMQAFNDWHVYQNLFENNASGFLFFNDIHYTGLVKPYNTYVVNNTFINNTLGAIYFRSLCANMSSNFVYNNIVVGPHAMFTTSDTCNELANLGVDDVEFDGNFYDLSGSFFNTEAAGEPSFATWQSGYSQDASASNGVDPLFVNAAAGNYRLQAGSTARNIGIDILDLDNDGDTADAIHAGAYITGNEVIGVT